MAFHDKARERSVKFWTSISASALADVAARLLCLILSVCRTVFPRRHAICTLVYLTHFKTEHPGDQNNDTPPSLRPAWTQVWERVSCRMLHEMNHTTAAPPISVMPHASITSSWSCCGLFWGSRKHAIMKAPWWPTAFPEMSRTLNSKGGRSCVCTCRLSM